MYGSPVDSRRGVLRPSQSGQRPLQFGALCYRNGGDGKEILLITSRGTGRWILPKGWPIDGLGGGEAAAQEAWEEAGVRAKHVGNKALGSYEFEKGLEDGGTLPVKITVFPVEVKSLAKDFPEAGERRRKWVSAAEAAKMVDEPGLQEILRAA